MKKINSLNSIRFFMMITIFFAHIPFIATTGFGQEIFYTIFNNGVFGVSFFFVLSGFIISIAYGDKYEVITLPDYISFIRKRVIRIYPLYIVTMLIFFISAIWEDFSFAPVVNQIVKLSVCIPMLQILFFKREVFQAFNGAAWFLSCLFILYMITPVILMINKRFRNYIKLSLFVPVLLYFIYLYLIYFIKYYYPDDFSFILNYHPLSRLFFYLEGILVGNLYLNICGRYSSKYDFVLFSTFEILATSAAIFFYVFQSKIPFSDYMICSYSLILFSILILIFAFEKGFISRILNYKLFVNLGNLSFEFYLIHYTVISFLSAGMQSYIGITDTGNLLTILILFAISIILSVLSTSLSTRYLKF